MRSVLVVGAGATGSTVVRLLVSEAAAHLLERILIIDSDTISVSNLPRLWYATIEDAAAGRSKAEALARSARAVAVSCSCSGAQAPPFIEHSCIAVCELTLRTLSSFDLIIGCVDDPAPRLFLSHIANDLFAGRCAYIDCGISEDDQAQVQWLAHPTRQVACAACTGWLSEHNELQAARKRRRLEVRRACTPRGAPPQSVEDVYVRVECAMQLAASACFESWRAVVFGDRESYRNPQSNTSILRVAYDVLRRGRARSESIGEVAASSAAAVTNEDGDCTGTKWAAEQIAAGIAAVHGVQLQDGLGDAEHHIGRVQASAPFSADLAAAQLVQCVLGVDRAAELGMFAREYSMRVFGEWSSVCENDCVARACAQRCASRRHSIELRRDEGFGCLCVRATQAVLRAHAAIGDPKAVARVRALAASSAGTTRAEPRDVFCTIARVRVHSMSCKPRVCDQLDGGQSLAAVSRILLRPAEWFQTASNGEPLGVWIDFGDPASSHFVRVIEA